MFVLSAQSAVQVGELCVLDDICKWTQISRCYVCVLSFANQGEDVVQLEATVTQAEWKIAVVLFGLLK